LVSRAYRRAGLGLIALYVNPLKSLEIYGITNESAKERTPPYSGGALFQCCLGTMRQIT